MLKPSALRTLAPQLSRPPALRAADAAKLVVAESPVQRSRAPALPEAASACRPRRRSIADNPSWQLLAKVLARRAGYPRHCHRRVCRRSGKCAGGSDACYLREFETMDVTIRRVLQENGRQWRADCEGEANP